MPLSESAGSTRNAPPHQAQDAQTLMSLLGNLVPLLMRFQTQPLSLAPGFFALDFGPNPALDFQAAICFLDNVASDELQTLSSYIDANVAQASGLESCKPIVAQARNCLAAHDYAQTFNLIWQAYRIVTAMRGTDPQLPLLRGVAAKAVPSPEAPAMHH